MMRRAGLLSVRAAMPPVAAVAPWQRRWCSATPSISPETSAEKPAAEGKTGSSATGESSKDDAGSSDPKSAPAFKIATAKVDPSQAIDGSKTDDSASHHKEADTDALIDASKAGYDKFGIPEQGSVEWYSRNALLREDRADQYKAMYTNDDCSAPPIIQKLAPKWAPKKNIYDYTDDIPKHVTPLYHWMPTQHRFALEEQRNVDPTWKWLLKAACWAAFFFGSLFIGVAFRFWLSQPQEIQKYRQDILQHSYGRVLELGAGSGSNIGTHPYPVTEITLADRSEHQLQRLRYRLPKTSYPKYAVRLIDIAGDLQEFEDGEFDTVVDMFGLCHYEDPARVLRMMQRVCKPTGTIILLEHGRSFWPGVSWILDYLAQGHCERTQGCQWNLPMEDFFIEAGLVIKEYKTDHFGTTKYVVAYPEPRDDNMSSLVEEEKRFQEHLAAQRRSSSPAEQAAAAA